MITQVIMQFNTKISKEEVEMEKIKRFFKEEEGVTSLEYGLIAAVTCVAILAALVLIGPRLAAIWNAIAAALA
jgi:pilus assembly protein Flp/PilA